MKSSWSTLAVGLALLALAACGGSRSTGNGDESGGGDAGIGNLCGGNDECPTGYCEPGGVCQPCDTCTSGTCTVYQLDAHCTPPQYCEQRVGHARQGFCVNPCSDDQDCTGFGETCYQATGRCLGGDTCNLTVDCGPMEVCAGGVCSAPPATCRFPEECPIGWICNSTGGVGTCVDPNAPIGPCNPLDAQPCGAYLVCGTGGAGCDCVGNLCQPKDGECDLDGDPDCATDKYCGPTLECVRALRCNDMATCVPHGHVCSTYGYCDNAPVCVDPSTTTPCSAATISAQQCACQESGWVCYYNQNPPVCLPQGMGECDRDSMCPADKYCDRFTQTCKTGCRDASGCTNNAACSAGSLCCCLEDPQTHARVCGPPPNGTACPSMGDQCGDDGDCPGGHICVCSGDGLLSALLGGCVDSFMNSVPKTCQPVCDKLIDTLFPQCEEGYCCGGGGGIFATLLGSLFGGGSSSSACVPGEDTNTDGQVDCPGLFSM